MNFWQAADAPYLVLDAAFHTTQKQGVVMWQAHGEKGFSPAHTATFPLATDGEFHRHIIPLSPHASYQGAILRLRLDPIGKGEPGAWMKVRSVRLSASPE